MDKLKKYRWLLGIVLIIIIGIYFIPIRHDINTIMNGVTLRIGDDDYIKEVSITVIGEYKQYVLKKDTFNGNISISDYPFTHDSPVLPITFDEHNQLSYSVYTDNQFVLKNIGFIECTPTFDNVIIGLMEPVGARESSWNPENGLYICAPATNRYEAEERLVRIRNKSEFIDYLFTQRSKM